MIYEFGDFTFDDGEGLLRRGGEPVALRAQPVRVLAAFLRSGGRLTTKQRLIEEAWQGRTVSDDAVYAQVRFLRSALGDTQIPHRVIETLHGQGFRMIVPVSVRAPAEPASSDRNTDQPLRTDGPPRVAILPLETRGNGETSLAHGLAEDTIDALSRLQSLAVISRLSTFAFERSAISDGQLARQLRADYAVSGAVERKGERTRIMVELADLADLSVVWSEQYDVPLEAMWDVRKDIAARLAHALDTRIVAKQAWRVKLRDPATLSAWQNYHLGMDDMFSGVPRKADTARASFLRAIELDPNFARAHAGMSQVSWWQMMAQPGQTDGLKAEVSRYAASAIACNRLDPFANFVMGRASWLRDGPDAGSPWFERAIAVSPSYAHAMGSYANYLSMAGQSEKAFRIMHRAIDLSPADPQLGMMYAVLSASRLLDGEVEEAAEWSRKALQEPAPSLMVLQGALMAFHEAGHFDEAGRIAEKLRSLGIEISAENYRRTLPLHSQTYFELIERSIAAYDL